MKVRELMSTPVATYQEGDFLDTTAASRYGSTSGQRREKNLLRNDTPQRSCKQTLAQPTVKKLLSTLARALALASGLAVYPQSGVTQTVALPAPDITGNASLETALATRRSNRRLAKTALSREILGQLLWAAQGITSEKGFRTAPSAGARYPLELYILLPTGLYHYLPAKHAIRQRTDKDLRSEVWKFVYGRPWLADAPAIFLITADYSRTTTKYGERGRRFVHIEVGHAAQNLLLQATALGLHCVGVGALHDKQVQSTLRLPKAHEPLYVLPVGFPYDTRGNARGP